MNTKYKHLNCEERTLIQLSLERGCTIRAIARSLIDVPALLVGNWPVTSGVVFGWCLLL